MSTRTDGGRGAEVERRRAAASRRRLRLDAEAITDVTLRLIDAEGIDAVSMRRVAAEFDTGPASLYAHVGGKDDLLLRALDRVMQEVDIPDDGPWQDVLRSWATGLRRALEPHRDLAKVNFAHIPSGERTLEILEVLLRSTSAAGVPPRVAAWAVDSIALYVTAHVYESHLMGQVHHDEAGRPSLEAGLDAIRGVGDYMASLDPDRFPQVRGHVDVMMSGGKDARFAFGLDALVLGIERRAELEREA